jgi:hypothetical protein
MTVFNWSTTAANNDDADTSINWTEGQAPSTINNSARAMMAAIAKWRNDMSGNLVTAGTSTAYTLTTNQVFTALTDGIMVTARMDEVNGASPTLNVDGLGAKSIASVYGTAIGTGLLKAGGVYTFVYDSTDDKWIVHGATWSDIPKGTIMLFYANTAPTGWTIYTTSGDNKAIRIVTGSGAGGGTGGAVGGSVAFTTAFASQTPAGTVAVSIANHTLSEANLPAHNHDVGTLAVAAHASHTHITQINSYATVQAGGSIDALVRSDEGLANGAENFTSGAPSAALTHSLSGSTANAGSGTAITHTVNSATFTGNAINLAVQYASYIAATKD